MTKTIITDVTVLFTLQVCLPLKTKNRERIKQSTRVKTQQEQEGAWKSPRNVITTLTGAPPRGRTSLSWSAILRPTT